jgi:2-methylisocitrate lyase-like PEP mutase family enzyme
MMRGVQDGTHGLSRAAAIAHAADLARFSGLPVNGDLEDGFGSEPEQVRATVEAAVAGGLAGLGIEDTTADPERPIHGFDHAVRRVRAAAQAARGRIVLTARADGLLHGSEDVDEIIRRLVAFADVGADVLYAPGLRALEDVRRVVEAVAPSPVNVLLPPAFSAAMIPELERCGVRRTSIGGAGFWLALRAVDRAAVSLIQHDEATLPVGLGEPSADDRLMT